ncbi:hypothetical protein BJY27_007813 [Streptomyces rapamycinicus]|uniref:Uncharacterized protein n=1 Tax=Streptomyces rapamycinicus TaxID=1226757 RepID=A0ABR6LWY6_9ACTN|nr:hypothetical protein [Streptomyces rapamycinicus]
MDRGGGLQHQPSQPVHQHPPHHEVRVRDPKLGHLRQADAGAARLERSDQRRLGQ